jgi:hypothetical protein
MAVCFLAASSFGFFPWSISVLSKRLSWQNLATGGSLLYGCWLPIDRVCSLLLRFCTLVISLFPPHNIIFQIRGVGFVLVSLAVLLIFSTTPEFVIMTSGTAAPNQPTTITYGGFGAFCCMISCLFFIGRKTFSHNIQVCHFILHFPFRSVIGGCRVGFEMQGYLRHRCEKMPELKFCRHSAFLLQLVFLSFQRYFSSYVYGSNL